MAFLGFFNVYSLRVNLSVAIVAMTEKRNVTLQNGTIVQEQDFNWDSTEQGLVLSSFFYGYILTQLIGGYLGSKFGGHYVSFYYWIISWYPVFITDNNLFTHSILKCNIKWKNVYLYTCALFTSSDTIVEST